MVLGALSRDYASFDPACAHLFNSYYETLGSRHPRAQRGPLNRPTCTDIAHYRAHVDLHIESLVAAADGAAWQRAAPLLNLGCHHEQQHQELLLVDISCVHSRAIGCGPLTGPQTNERPARRRPRSRLRGLRSQVKTIPCKYFYDERGAALFEAICKTPEYYPTRTEIALLERRGAEFATLIGREAQISNTARAPAPKRAFWWKLPRKNHMSPSISRWSSFIPRRWR